jgi:hypothetical protein
VWTTKVRSKGRRKMADMLTYILADVEEWALNVREDGDERNA